MNEYYLTAEDNGFAVWNDYGVCVFFVSQYANDYNGWTIANNVVKLLCNGIQS